MALKAKKQKYHTPEEYLALERKAEEMSEFHNGSILRRASSNLDHNSIMTNFACEIGSQLRAEKVNVLGVGVKVRTKDADYFLYPDVLILKNKPIFHDNEKDVVLNPTAVVEIYSKETSLFDRNDKFVIYQKFESIKEIIFICQYKPAVQTFFRVTGDVWKCNGTIGIESEVYFESVEKTLKLSEIYDLVEFEQ